MQTPRSEMHLSRGPGVREQLLEVLVFLFLIVPSMVLALFTYQQQTASFGLVAVATILRDLALVSLIFFFLWRNGEPTARIGWTKRDRWREVGLGILLFVPFFFFAAGLERLFVTSGLHQPQSLPSFLLPHGPASRGLAFVLVAIVAVSEEVMFRGYLIRRFTSVTRSVPAAIVLAAVVFSIGHGYEGTAGVATVGMMGVVFGVIYWWRQSLTAPIVMHFLQDFITMVVLPLVIQAGASR